MPVAPSPLSQLSPFVPEIVRALLETNPQPLETPWSVRLEGAIVRVLIDGFSGLAETFSERPADGVRLMSQAVESFFGERVGIVHAFGGSTVLIDALGMVLLFPAAVSPEARFLAARAGLGACLQLRGSAGPGRGRPGARGPSLDIRIGCHFGEVSLGAVGSNGWHFILAGPGMEQADAAATRAQPGEVMATDGILSIVGTVRTEGTFHEGRASVIGSPPPEDRLEPVQAGLRGGDEELERRIVEAVPPAVRELTGRNLAIGRFEHAAVLHVLVDGLGMRQDKAFEHVHMLASRAAETCAELGGMLEAVGMDDAQSWLSLAFPEAEPSPSSSRAALHAALDLRRRLALPRLRGLHFGLVAGTVFRTALGGPVRRQFGILGPPLEAAVRLAALAAPGQILVDDEVRSQAGSLFEFETQNVRTTVSGLRARTDARRTQTREVQVLLRSLDPLRRAVGDIPFVGRQVELAMCETAVLEAGQGQGSALRILGTRGAGKTRLFTAVAARAHEQGVPVLRVRCGPAQDPMDLGPLQELLGALAEEPATAEGLDVRELARRLANELRRVSEQGPIVITIDDLHLASPLVQGLTHKLGALLGRLRVALLLAEQPEDQPSAENEPTGLEIVELVPLTPEELDELATHLRDGQAVPVELREALFEHSEGHPLRLAELLRAVEQMTPESRSAESIRALPAQLLELIRWRIARLEPELGETLRLAAALDRPAPLEELRSVHPDPGALSSLIARLGARGFLLQLTGQDPVLLDFAEPLQAEAVLTAGTPEPQTSTESPSDPAPADQPTDAPGQVADALGQVAESATEPDTSVQSAAPADDPSRESAPLDSVP